MVSVSQDCLMKVWNTKEFGGSDLTSSATIRSHAGSIFTITGNDDLLFTGGIEGVIRAWTIPHKADSNANKYLKGSWVNGNKDETMEPIWQLLYDNNNVILNGFRNNSTLPHPTMQLRCTRYSRRRSHKPFTKWHPKFFKHIDPNPKILVI